MQINQIKLQNKIKVTCFNYLQIQLIRPPPLIIAWVSEPVRPKRRFPHDSEVISPHGSHWSVRANAQMRLLVRHHLPRIQRQGLSNGTDDPRGNQCNA